MQTLLIILLITYFAPLGAGPGCSKPIAAPPAIRSNPEPTPKQSVFVASLLSLDRYPDVRLKVCDDGGIFAYCIYHADLGVGQYPIVVSTATYSPGDDVTVFSTRTLTSARVNLEHVPANEHVRTCRVVMRYLDDEIEELKKRIYPK